MSSGRSPAESASFRRSPLGCGRERRRVCHPNEFATDPPGARVRPRSSRHFSLRQPRVPRRDTALRNTAPCLAPRHTRRIAEPNCRASLRQPLAPSTVRERAFSAAQAPYCRHRQRLPSPVRKSLHRKMRLQVCLTFKTAAPARDTTASAAVDSRPGRCQTAAPPALPHH